LIGTLVLSSQVAAGVDGVPEGTAAPVEVAPPVVVVAPATIYRGVHKLMPGHWMRVADGVWAIGDITGKGAFTHVSMYQGAVVAHRPTCSQRGSPWRPSLTDGRLNPTR